MEEGKPTDEKKTEDKKEAGEEAPVLSTLSETEAKALSESMVLGKANWLYKPDSFVLVPKGGVAGSYWVLPSHDLGEEVVKVTGIRPFDAEAAQKPGFMEAFPKAIRKATPADMTIRDGNIELGKELARFTQDNSDKANLGMAVMGGFVAMDRHKILIVYTAEGRVDFRELLKIVAAKAKMRIEFRQIGARDKAKLVGGIGVCGLPLCCKTFLTAFQGITIAMAKTQMLSLNIPKLSGQCGKLMCCLAYENADYAKLRPLYPKLGESITISGKKFKVANISLLADTITVTDGETYETYSSANWHKILGEKDAVLGRGVALPQAKASAWNCQGFGEEKADSVKEPEPPKSEGNPSVENAENDSRQNEESDGNEDEEATKEKPSDMDNRNHSYQKNRNNRFHGHGNSHGGNNRGGRDNNRDYNGHGNNRHGGGQGFQRPGPFGFKPRPMAASEQAAANPFGFASHNGAGAKAEAKSASNHRSEPRSNSGSHRPEARPASAPVKLTVPPAESGSENKD